MYFHHSWSLILFLAATACGTVAESPADGTIQDDPTEEDAVTATTRDDPSAPLILSLSSTVSTLDQGDGVDVIAIVTDPDGIEDLIGGQLVDTEGNTYAAFATSAQEGAYTASLTWDHINQVAELSFAGSLERSFVAEFFDVDGHSVSAELTLAFVCEAEDTEGACDGQCADLDTDPDHCGACDNPCASGGTCEEGQCVYSFVVDDGPVWSSDPPVYNCIEACALLYGGVASDWQCSTQKDTIDNMAFVSGYGDDSFCDSPVPETMSLGTSYNCGVTGCAFSAYVSDQCGSFDRNWCFLR